jgi:DNA-binding transcriptional ArsR family regulator
MPAWDEAHDPSRRVLVEPSAPAELFWALLALAKGRAFRPLPGLLEDTALAEQVRAMWKGAGHYAFNELLVLAHRGGVLLSSDIEPFLAHLEDIVSQPSGELRLRTEPPDEAKVIRDRLSTLKRDATLCAHYGQVLNTTWQRVEPTWRTVGRTTVEHSARAMRERLTRGASLGELLPEGHMARHYRRGELLALITDAEPDGAVALSPLYFSSAGSHVLDLPGLIHVGVPIEDADPRQQLAHVAEHVARRAKVLSDPTRVALLADLIRRPASITELAERFELSQPTVSMHVKALREADLLDAAKNGTRTTYSVDRERLQWMFDDLQGMLLPKTVP